MATAAPASPLLLLRPTVIWPLCLAGLLVSLYVDYWGTVGFFQRCGLWIPTDFAGSPLPFTNAMDVALPLGLPLGLLGVPVAALDLVRGRRRLALVEACGSAVMLTLALFSLGVL
jgi:hypothetical protein